MIIEPRPMRLDRPIGAVTSGSVNRINHTLAKGCANCGDETAQLVCRTILGGATTVILQCVGCGNQLGGAMPLIEHPDRDGYPTWVTDEAESERVVARDADPNLPPETEVSAHVRRHLNRIQSDGRVEWRSEVRLLVHTHACRGKADTLRVDYVASFDGGPLIGLEIKRRPDQPADLGRGLFQCAQYAMGQVAAAQAGSIPQVWIGQPLKAVFLRIDSRNLRPTIVDHAKSAVRLYGPANVGFVTFSQHTGMRLDLGGDRWWSERDGYRENAATRTHRVGNGSFQASGK